MTVTIVYRCYHDDDDYYYYYFYYCYSVLTPPFEAEHEVRG